MYISIFASIINCLDVYIHTYAYCVEERPECFSKLSLFVSIMMRPSDYLQLLRKPSQRKLWRAAPTDSQVSGNLPHASCQYHWWGLACLDPVGVVTRAWDSMMNKGNTNTNHTAEPGAGCSVVLPPLEPALCTHGVREGEETKTAIVILRASVPDA